MGEDFHNIFVQCISCVNILNETCLNHFYDDYLHAFCLRWCVSQEQLADATEQMNEYVDKYMVQLEVNEEQRQIIDALEKKMELFKELK